MSKNQNNQSSQNNNQFNASGPSTPKFDIPNFELPRMEVPAAFRELTEKTVAQTKENYDRLKQAAQETSGVVENAFNAYSKGSLELTSKLLDNAQTQTNALFDFVKSLMDSQTVAEAFEKQATFTRTQFETMTTQGRELQEMTTKIANDTSAPIKSAAQKAASQFNQKTA